MSAEGVEYGDYFLIGRLARGGMAEVFLAKSLFGDRERLLAVKRTLSEYSGEDDFISMFTDEARIASGLTHPNICHILDHGQIGDQRFLVMEFIHGKDLKVVAHRARQRGELVPSELVAYTLARIASALHEAHTKRNSKGELENIVHRDISPQNILISYEGEPKLIDFGIAKAKDRLSKTQAGVVKGKFAYMSPEQAIGGEVDARTDIFALGVVLYELVVGALPFKGSSDFSTLKRVARAEYTPPPTDRVPAKLVSVIQKALTRSPNDRYATAADFAHDLDGFLTDLGKEVQPAQLSSYMRKLFRDDYIREMGRIKQYLAVEPPKVDREPLTQRLPVGAIAPAGDDDRTRRTTSPQPMADEHTKETRDLVAEVAQLRAPSADEEATRITSSAELAAGFAGDDDDEEVTGLAELLEPNADTVDNEASAIVSKLAAAKRDTTPQRGSAADDDDDDEPTQMTEFQFTESTKEIPAPFADSDVMRMSAVEKLGSEPVARAVEIIEVEPAPAPVSASKTATAPSIALAIDEELDIDSSDLELVSPVASAPSAPPGPAPSTRPRSDRSDRARRRPESVKSESAKAARPATGANKTANKTASKTRGKTSARRKAARASAAGNLTKGEKITLGVVAGFCLLFVFCTYYITRVGVPPFAASLQPSLEKITGELPLHPDRLQPAPPGAGVDPVPESPETAAHDKRSR